MAFQLQSLPYAYDALEPYIDTLTMQIHHDKHHATYINNLNGIIEKYPELAGKSLEELLGNINALPEDIRTPIRNQGGGVWNHNIYWEIMGPKAGGEPKGKLAQAIEAAFGSLTNFRTEFEKAAIGRFGSGWAWLVKKGSGLAIVSTANQDTPLSDGLTPILALDVWEHAYYLKYQNRRAEYASSFWNVVNWEAVAGKYAAK
ncbi:MAG: superoxide dismutase [Anaerolineales bacterium]|nr:superoxide dismutase [Anaerolineales bacterium]